MINLLKKAINNVTMNTVMQSTIDVCARRVKFSYRWPKLFMREKYFTGV